MMYVSPCSGLSDQEAIQQAVNSAAETDIRTVVIPATKTWVLDKPVLLPTGVTLILDGAQIRAEGIAFTNAHADAPDKLCLGGEQDHLFLLGTKDAAIAGSTAPQVAFKNMKDYGISGISFVGGEGLQLLHCRYGKVQKLQFTGSRYGIFLGEGCNNNLLEDIVADTKEEAVIWSAGDTAVWGRSTDMYDSVLSRLDAKTGGAPAVAVCAGSVVANNLFIRDITDRTKGTGVTVDLGKHSHTELLDLTVRGIKSARTTVSVSDNCDGVYLGNLQGSDAVIAPKATRVYEEACTEAVATPRLEKPADMEWLDANDPKFAGATDYETLQNAIHAAAGKCLVIPRRNTRTGKTVWNVEKTLQIPSDTTLVLLDAHLRLADFTYCNLFTNENAAKNIRILGVGSATLDSGKFNGLKVKNANTLGLGPITDNALLLFSGVDGLIAENLHMIQNRWYCILCVGCTKGRLSNLDICAHPNFPDMGGIRIHSGCRDMLVENITGLTGEDTVVVAAEPEDAVFKPACGDISDIHIRTVKANASRSNIVTVKAHGGRKVSRVLAETLLDCSLPEQKKLPFATVQLGDTASENLQDIRVRDLNGRSAATVQLGGSSEDIAVSNIHSYGSSDNALRTFPLPESFDYQLGNVLMDLAEMDRGYRATVKKLRVNGVFFRCQQASRYMRGTATSIITDKKKFLGTVVELRNFRAEDVQIENVLADRVGNGIRVTGQADVEVANFQAAEIGRAAATCGGNCHLVINGETIPVKDTQAL